MDPTPSNSVPFGRKNWTLFALGLATIALGYVLLSIPPVDGFLSLTLAPIFLVVGYCVLIPLAILAKDRPDAAEDAVESP